MKEAGIHIAVLSRQLNLYLRHELEESGLTAPELPYLAQLYVRDGLTQEELSQTLSIDRAATTRTMQSLERKGLVRRKADREDKRIKRVFLTPRALAYEDRLRALQERWTACITQDMTEEQSSLFARQLARMADRARELNQQEVHGQ